LIKKSSTFIVDYFFHTSLVAALLYLNSQLIRGFQIDYLILFLIFFGTLAVYNYSNLSTNNIKTRKFLIVTSIIVCGIISFLNYKILVENNLKIIVILLILLFYIFPNLSFRLRNIGLLKILLLASAWALSAVLVNDSRNSITQSTFILNFFFIMSISIPFDMRDMEIDNLDTIPKKFGLKTAIIISIALYIISIFIQYSLTQSLIILLSMIIIGVYALLKSVKYYSNKFYLALLELLVAINTILLLANEAFK